MKLLGSLRRPLPNAGVAAPYSASVRQSYLIWLNFCQHRPVKRMDRIVQHLDIDGFGSVFRSVLCRHAALGVAHERADDMVRGSGLDGSVLERVPVRIERQALVVDLERFTQMDRKSA